MTAVTLCECFARDGLQHEPQLSLLVSATESHTRKNLNRTRAEQWQNIADMVKAADGRFRLVGTVSVAFGCPFEGKVDPEIVVEDVQRFAGLGVEHVALGDTTGMATPLMVRSLFSEIQNNAKAIPIAHFHDTRGTGLVNYVAAFEAGVRHFDSSFGGVGGHPAK
jgi:hydroxymethylglutaryl-CoA lyase